MANAVDALRSLMTEKQNRANPPTLVIQFTVDTRRIAAIGCIHQTLF